MTDDTKGPLLVQGDLDIIGAPEQVPGFRASLCSCGQSANKPCGHSGNKPFCDGSHRSSDFTG